MKLKILKFKKNFEKCKLANTILCKNIVRINDQWQEINSLESIIMKLQRMLSVCRLLYFGWQIGCSGYFVNVPL